MTEFAVEVVRTVRASRDRVFRAFIDPELLVQWMAPREAAVVSNADVDPREGGAHRVEYLTADGTRHAFDSVIREIVPGERIVLDFVFDHPARGVREETELVVTLNDAPGGGTEVRLDQRRMQERGPFNEQSVNSGWNGVLDKLEALFEGGTQ